MYGTSFRAALTRSTKSPLTVRRYRSAGPKPFTWDETIPYLSEKLDIPYIDVVSPGTPTHYQFDLSKARNLIGFEPQYDIITMIDDALRYQNGEDIDVLPT